MRITLLLFLAIMPNAMGNTGANCPPTTSADTSSYALHPADHSGDYLYIAGIFGVHDAGVEEDSCGLIRTRGVQNLEAFLWAVNTFKTRYPNALKNISVGAIGFDSCGSINNIRKHMSAITECKEGYGPEGSFVDPERIMGYVGPDHANEAINLWQDFDNYSMPLISHAVTTPSLSKIPSVLRTVPSDMDQVYAMAAVVKKMKWKAVQTVNSDNRFGTSVVKTFNKLIKDDNICVVNAEVIPSKTPSDVALDKVIQGLRQFPDTKGVIICGQAFTSKLLLQAAKRANAKGEFHWVGSDSWGISEDIIKDAEEYALGALTLTLDSDVNGVDEFMTALQSKRSSTENPWLSEYIEAGYDPSTDEMDVYTPYVILAVDSLLNAVERVRALSCTTPRLCDSFLNSPDMLRSIKQSLLEGDDPVKLDANTGDLLSERHYVYNYQNNQGQECGGKESCYIKVGTYSKENINVDFDGSVYVYDKNGNIQFDTGSICAGCIECAGSGGADMITAGTLIWLPLVLWPLKG